MILNLQGFNFFTFSHILKVKIDGHDFYFCFDFSLFKKNQIVLIYTITFK